MNRHGSLLELRCPKCTATELCGAPQMLARLQALGMLKREKEPSPDLVSELFVGAAGRFHCDQCGAVGLQIREASGDEWGEAKCCISCGKAIPEERLDVYPQATYCAACQQKDDSGGVDQHDYCPKCGNIMSVRPQRSSGITRYVLACPQCR